MPKMDIEELFIVSEKDPLKFPLTVENFSIPPGEYFIINIVFKEKPDTAQLNMTFKNADGVVPIDAVNYRMSVKATIENNEDKDEDEDEDSTGNGTNKKWYIIGGSVLLLLIIGAVALYYLRRPKPQPMSFRRRR